MYTPGFIKKTNHFPFAITSAKVYQFSYFFTI